MTLDDVSIDNVHKAALERFLSQPLNPSIIESLVAASSSVVGCCRTPQPILSSGNEACEAQSGTDHWQTACCNRMPNMEQFITQLVVRSGVPTTTLISTLIYLSRLRHRIAFTDWEVTHRTFLACLILATKYMGSTASTSAQWAAWSFMYRGPFSVHFGVSDVERMERDVFFVLQCDVDITNHDFGNWLDPFLAPIQMEITKQRESVEGWVLEQVELHNTSASEVVCGSCIEE